ncbi:ComEA family DNA-binding protein [Geodermatophilus sabuli]|uniref:Competence protein ComEA n=1 Tax=Geodermatophilus sabuli TaxID=1564158 RepID=A0A285E600_9ACTN|nr:ComEA family DNA-binding protein [Geodermatophilus sabuli]MBB3082603.1 competence protein ComEA [Geodermatophilus sabuli]SNX94529.1 competence protein ComEA [Geodermatophilus sabuli]
MRLSSRRSDDADLIRARLRALLDERGGPTGWVPADEPVDEEEAWADEAGTPSAPDEYEERGRAAELPDGIGRHRAPGSAVRLDPGRRGAWALWVAGLLAAVLVAVLTWVDRPRVQPAPGTSASAGTSAEAPATDAPPPDAPSAGASPSDASSAGAPASPSVGVAADSSATVVVAVVGLVARPGLVVVPAGARVADAVAAAGGLLPEADIASVNLAAVVSDGEQVAVGVPGAAGSGAAAPGPAAPGRVDLNTATAADLDALPGIGPVLAQRIVEHREQQGRFTSVEQLDDVPGIGPATYAELAELVTV